MVRIFTRWREGIEARKVDIQVRVALGIPGFSVVGMAQCGTRHTMIAGTGRPHT
jgi:hypothetical protein